MAKKKVVDKNVDDVEMANNVKNVENVEGNVDNSLKVGDVVTVTGTVRFTNMYSSAAPMPIKAKKAEIIALEKNVEHPVRCLIDGIECWMDEKDLKK